MIEPRSGRNTDNPPLVLLLSWPASDRAATLLPDQVVMDTVKTDRQIRTRWQGWQDLQPSPVA